jgi:glucose-6-phosphate isomerase
VNVDALMAGAQTAMEELAVCSISNPCYRWAMARNILYRKGKTTELMACYEPDFTLMNEWYKQLFGESEGKDQKGIFPASVIFSTDLHSMGQYVQDGLRNLFETVVDIQKPRSEATIPDTGEDADGLGFVAGKPLSFVNHKAMQGTMLAHSDGGVPIMALEVPSLAEADLGYLLYFFEKACAISGYVLGVNPFNQPGV